MRCNKKLLKDSLQWYGSDGPQSVPVEDKGDIPPSVSSTETGFYRTQVRRLNRIIVVQVLNLGLQDESLS